MSARIYDRPDLDQRQRMPPLFVTGNLPKAPPMAAYEGRLEIHNGIGGCTVRQIDGDRLPPGHRLYVDQAAKQVVLAWPAYQAGAAPIINPGFESGPTGWDTGAGWVIATENPPTGSWAAGYNNQQGESVISNTARYECYPGQRTAAKCKVRQGASAEGNAGASVLLEYRDAAGVVVLPVEGNRVMSASKNRVYDSNVVGTAPAGAATVNIAGNGIRFRENKILFVDDFEWDHTVAAVGLDHDAVFRITLQVSDSAGRSAIWSGVIGDRSTYFTSRPYGITAPIEGLSAATPVLAGSRMFVGSYADGERLAGAVPVFLTGTLRTPLHQVSWEERLSVPAPAFAAGTLRSEVLLYSTDERLYPAAPAFAVGTLRKLLIETTTRESISTTAPRFLSGTLT